MVLYYRLILLAGGLLLCLFPGCNLSKDEIPEPNYDPFVLLPGTYVEAKGRVVNMDAMAPPDTVIVKGQWKEAKRLEPRKLKSNYLAVVEPKYLSTSPVPVDMDQFEKPIFIPTEGIKKSITLPPGIPAQISVESTDNYYMGMLDQKSGLYSNWIDALLEDRQGRVWIGTNTGVNLWDGSTLINLSHQDGLPEAFVIDFLEDSEGNIWIAFNGHGLFVWNGEEFMSYTIEEGLSDNRVKSLMEDRSGKIWIGTANGLNIWDGRGFSHYYTKQGLSNNSIMDLAEDHNGTIWIGTWGSGVNLWDGKEFSRLTTKDGLSNNYITKVLTDINGNVWLGTAGGGINKWDGQGLSYYTGKEGPAGIQYPTEIMEDSKGNIWIGGNYGVDIYDGKGYKNISESDGLKWRVVVSLLEDSSGRIWIGTSGGGLHILTTPDTKHYASNESLWYNSGYLDLLEDESGNLWIQSEKLGLVAHDDLNNLRLFEIHTGGYDMNSTLYQDSYMNLIVGSMGIKTFEMVQFTKETPKYLYYKFDTTVCAKNIGIMAIMEDNNQNIWLGGSGDSGILFWDRSVNTTEDSVRFLQYSIEQGLDARWVSTLLQDDQGRIWIGSGAGLSVWDGSKLTRFTEEDGLSSNAIQDMTMDGEGNIWIATKGGINIWDDHGFMRYTKQQGLPTNQIGSLYFDKNANLWAGTQDGLIKLWIGVHNKVHFRKYNEYRGVGNSSVFETLIDQNNKFWAISRRNLDIVDLEHLALDTIKPKLAIRQLQPFYDQFDWRQVSNTIIAGETILTGDQEIPLSKVKYDSVYRFSNLPVEPEFPYNINQLSFQWSSTYWEDPTSIQYSYILEGQDQNWSPLIRENKVTYNNLQSGEYTLKVRAVAGNARWSDTASYSFRVNPPLWATAGAYTLYGLCALGLVFGLRRYERKRFVLKQKAKSLEEIDRTKTEFFTNISHELRTPLTLILGPLKALQEDTYKGDKRSLLKMMSQNGSRLLRLVNQLLDLSKIDQGKLKLELEYCDVNELVRSVVSNFDSAANIKHIDLEFYGNEDPVKNGIDKEKIRQVLYNLINNALKFTPEGGNIRVSVAAFDGSETPNRSEAPNKFPDGAIDIVVKDSGIGIPKKELNNIFNRFYQVNNPNHDESEGTGIGLALAQKLVHLHNGTIEVESEHGWGTTFTVTLPVVTAPEKTVTVVRSQQEIDSSHTFESGANVADRAEKETDTLAFTNEPVNDAPIRSESNNHNYPLLLIVEDNAQMRQYIKSCLGDNYTYLEASNGAEGLQLVDGKLPDLILCDVMMPKMDGYEFCERIRKQQATGHIPFIFLTAKADHDSQIKGLEIGSTDYLVKPFDADELRLKIRNHLDRMQQFRSFFGKQLTIKGDIDVVDSLDERFLKKAIAVVEDHIDNHEFSVNEFSQQAAMSQTQLYRKLITLTGLSPSAFIRSIRLKKAGQLILQNYGNTSDVAYAVGFNNLSYFAKCFREQFGVSPSGYGKKGVPNS